MDPSDLWASPKAVANVSTSDDTTTAPCHFDRLPDELVVNIMSQVVGVEVGSERFEQLAAFAALSRRFARLTLDPSLWTVVEIAGPGEEDAELVLRRCSLLRHLTMSKSPNAAALTKVAVESSPNCLVRLDVEYCETLSADFLADVGSSSITCLGLVGNGRQLGDPFVTHAAHLANLESLSLFNSRCLTGAGLRAIADHCRRLTTLNLEEVTHLDEDSVNHMLKTLGANLTTLFLDGEGLDDGCFANLSACPRLLHLGITFSEGIGPAGIRAISTLSGLRSLKVRRGKALDSQDFVRAFGGKRLSQLTSLDLSECVGLDDDGLASVAENCGNLVTLTLNWCWDVTDDGV